MSAKRILVLGGGFAGLWSAVGAARKLNELGQGSEVVEVVLVNRDAFHSIRVRNYEADLSPTRVPLETVLGPIGVRRMEGEVTHIDLAGQAVRVATVGGQEILPYDRLVFALGSQIIHPNIPPGLVEHTFNVDTYNGALKLNNHLQSLPDRSAFPGRFTVMVIGAGLTGIEVATEMPGKLRAILSRANLTQPFRIILADRNPFVGSDMGESARPIIEQALAALEIETRLGIAIASINETGITLQSGEKIPTATVVWCAGLQANPLTQLFPVERDRFGRVPVDEFMRAQGVSNVFVAGDAAQAMVDSGHESVMSCQHSRPMGRFAGHNVVCDLLNLPLLPLRIVWYVTVLDLGPWGAVYTQGWDRHVIAKGETAKKTKQVINRHRIYPPQTRNCHDILVAAAPVVSSPPEVKEANGSGG